MKQGTSVGFVAILVALCLMWCPCAADAEEIAAVNGCVDAFAVEQACSDQTVETDQDEDSTAPDGGHPSTDSVFEGEDPCVGPSESDDNDPIVILDAADADEADADAGDASSGEDNSGDYAICNKEAAVPAGGELDALPTIAEEIGDPVLETPTAHVSEVEVEPAKGDGLVAADGLEGTVPQKTFVGERLVDEPAAEAEIAQPSSEESAEEPEVEELVEGSSEESSQEPAILEVEATETGPSGEGWKKVNGAWHYTNPKTNKSYKDGVYKIAGEQYCFDPSGAMVTGWMAIDGEVYYFDPATGAMATSCDLVIKGLSAPLNAASGLSFNDVSSDTPHADDIQWALESGISTGWVSKSGRTFRPLSNLARADMAAFLYRLAGSPAFVAEAEDTAFFSDVTPETAHAAEIWWLASTGISTGWEETNGTRTFRPLSELARADMAAFLYRLAGSPSYKPTKNDRAYFSDVDSETPHAKEVWWLGSTGISTGWVESDGSRTFRPYDSLARADMAAFLHRTVSNGTYEPAASHEYRFADDGTLVTGWSDGSFYDPTTGALIEAGWAKDGSKWSYIDPETGETLKGGLHEIAGYTYMFNSSGLMRRGWVESGGAKRFFNKTSGVMCANGIYEIDSDRYCFAKDGALRYGLVKRGSATYYFNPETGAMAHGWVTVDGEKLFFDNTTGKMCTFTTTGNAELDKILWEMIERFGCNGRTSLKSAYEWIATFPYKAMSTYPSGDWDSWSMPYAVYMYKNQTGNCYRYSALTCWYARAIGFDAIAISGESRTATGWQPHSWAEVTVNGTAYVVDTQQHGRSWNEGRNFFMVSYEKAPLYYRLTNGTRLN